MLIIGNSLNLVYFREKEIIKQSFRYPAFILFYLLDLSMHEKWNGFVEIQNENHISAYQELFIWSWADSVRLAGSPM